MATTSAAAAALSAIATGGTRRSVDDSEMSMLVYLLRFWAVAATIVFKIILVYLALFLFGPDALASALLAGGLRLLLWLGPRLRPLLARFWPNIRIAVRT